jgi:MFS family permease
VPSNGVLAYPAFVRLWLSGSVSWLGSFTFGLALQLLLIENLSADQTAIGFVRSAQWLPALAVGLLAGVLTDRMRRRPVLIAADTATALATGSIAALALTGLLTVPVLAVLVAVVGSASMFFHAAHQSYLPQLVPMELLPVANARVEQTTTAAEALGPLVVGVLVRFLGAPAAIVFNAVSHAVAALLLASIRVDEPAPERQPDRKLWQELVEGGSWVYRHRTLAPYAVSLHLWFLANSALMTVFVFHATEELGLSALTVGLVFSCAGITGVIGAGLAPRAAERHGVGRVCVAAAWSHPLAYLFLFVAPPGAIGAALLVAGQLVNGLGLGIKGPLDLSYRNAVTPDRLRARMNGTIRAFNWGSIALAAPLAGLAATAYGDRPVIAAGIGVLVVSALVLTLSPFRRAELPAAYA